MINPRYSLGHGDWFVPYDMRKHYGEELLDAVNKHEPNPLIKRGIPLTDNKLAKGGYFPKPSVGRIVHYTHAYLVGDGEEGFPEIDLVTHAAIVVGVVESKTYLEIYPAPVRQKVMGSVDEFETLLHYPPKSRKQVEEGYEFSITPKPGCWSWPPRD